MVTVIMPAQVGGGPGRCEDRRVDPRDALRDAALGATPGRWPLPPAPDPEAAWWRAVALGGQGRHAAAATALTALRRPAVDPVLRSLAASTQASLRRQRGGHAAAAGPDGAALALVAGLPGAGAAQARADALTGLAADALGGPRPAVALRLLARARADVDALGALGDVGALGAGAWRAELRWRWVRAETALRLDDPATARAQAGAAASLAEAVPSVRHRVKTTLLLAAATGTGDGASAAGDAVALAVRARDSALDHGLSPLAWAAAMLLGALGPRLGGSAGARLVEDSRRAATASEWIITQRGG